MRGSAISFLTLASIALPDSFLVLFLGIYPLWCKPEAIKFNLAKRTGRGDLTEILYQWQEPSLGRSEYLQRIFRLGYSEIQVLRKIRLKSKIPA